MANFKASPIFATHNDYYTPKSAWENIKPFIDVRHIIDLADLNIMRLKEIQNFIRSIVVSISFFKSFQKDLSN